jgi:hypothetical protein
MDPEDGDGIVRDLPFSQGFGFAALDEYLAHLRRRGAAGIPYYDEVAPDLYELVARRGRGATPERISRAELMLRFGFSR